MPTAEQPYRQHRAPTAYRGADFDAEIDDIYRWLKRIVEETGVTGVGPPGSSVINPHEILSATHTDTTVDTPVDGDLMIRSGSYWIRLGIGTADMVLRAVTGIPAWSFIVDAMVDAAAAIAWTKIDKAGSSLGDLTTRSATDLTSGNLAIARLNNGTDASAATFWRGDGVWEAAGGTQDVPLLDGDEHNDTIASTPQAGDLVYAEAGEIEGLDKVFFSGATIGGLPIGETSGLSFFFGGAAVPVMYGDIAVAKWVRKPLSELLTSDLFQTSGASAYRSTNFVLADATPTAVSFEAVTFDDAVFWSSGSPTRLTIPAAQAGTYVIEACGNWASAMVGVAFVAIYVNGVKFSRTVTAVGNLVTSADNVAVLTSIARLVAGDYVQLVLEHKKNVPGSHTIIGGATATYLKIIKV